jgi:hypothetical protein
MGAGLAAELAVLAVLQFSLSAEFLLTVIALVVTYILVWKRSVKGYSGIIDKNILIAYCVLAVIMVVAFWGMKVSYVRMAPIWGFFYLAVCYALASNQSNIDFMMARRKHKMEHLPGNVRKRSLVLILIVLAAAFCCILLTPQITWLFTQALTAVKVILVGIIRFIVRLIPSGSGEETAEESVAGTAGDMGGMMGDDEGSPLWDYIMWPLITLVTLWLLYTYRDDIMRWLITLWRTLRTKVRGALFSAPKRMRMGGDGEGDYEDEVVELSAVEVREELRQSGFKLRQWKKELRACRQMEDGADKYRRGYRLALQWLGWKKVPLKDSDTPLEVLEKAKTTLSRTDWAAVTDWYNCIRYAEPALFPQAAMPTLMESLDAMEKMK